MVAPNGQQFFEDHCDELQLAPEISTAVDSTGVPITRVRSNPLYSLTSQTVETVDENYESYKVKITDLGIGMYFVALT